METGAGSISEGSSSNTDGGSDAVVKTRVTGAPVEVENGADQVESEEPRAAIIAPATPLPVKEVRDIRAPRAVVQCRLAKDDVEDVEKCGSSCTPKQGVFDPFVPGPNDMCLAPKLRKKTGESRVNVARQLNFDSSSSSGSSKILGKMKSVDEKLLESLSGDILDVVVPSSTELDEVEKVVPEPESDGFKTPPLVPCFNRTANKCPDAPMKQGKTVSKRLHIDSSFCRKLEF